jgi:hypothetical protein
MKSTFAGRDGRRSMYLELFVDLVSNIGYALWRFGVAAGEVRPSAAGESSFFRPKEVEALMTWVFRHPGIVRICVLDGAQHE